MIGGDGEQVLLTISAHPTLEETIIDWLLERETGPGFTSFAIRGHSSRHAHLTVTEQVSGRQRRTRFEVVLDAGVVESFLAGLKQAFAGTDMHYWAVPVLASGNLNGAA